MHPNLRDVKTKKKKKSHPKSEWGGKPEEVFSRRGTQSDLRCQTVTLASLHSGEKTVVEEMVRAEQHSEKPLKLSIQETVVAPTNG